MLDNWKCPLINRNSFATEELFPRPMHKDIHFNFYNKEYVSQYWYRNNLYLAITFPSELSTVMYYYLSFTYSIIKWVSLKRRAPTWNKKKINIGAKKPHTYKLQFLS